MSPLNDWHATTRGFSKAVRPSLILGLLLSAAVPLYAWNNPCGCEDADCNGPLTPEPTRSPGPALNTGCSSCGRPRVWVSAPTHSARALDTPYYYRPAKGPEFSFRMAYASDDERNRSSEPWPIGYRWSHPYACYLENAGSNKRLYFSRVYLTFIPDGAGGWLTTNTQYIAGGASEYALHANGADYTVSLRSGGAYEFEDDGSGARYRLKTVISDRGNEIDLTYDVDGYLEKLITADSVTNTFSSDANGRVIQITDGVCTASFAYGGPYDDLLTNAVDMAGRSYFYAYDTSGRLTNVNYEGHITAINYTNQVTVTSPESRAEKSYVVDNDYVVREDGLGNITQLRYKRNYSWGDSVIEREDPLGNVTQYTHYDNTNSLINGKLQALVQPDGRITQYTYDSLGNTTETLYRDAESNVTRRTVSAYTYFTDRDIAESVATEQKDADGNVLAESIRTYTRQEGATTNAWDDIYLLSSVSNQVSAGSYAETRYEYDASYRLLCEKVRTASGAGDFVPVNSYVYDADGRVSSMTNATGIVTAYTYNSRGLVHTTADNAGIRTNSYDLLDRLIKVEYPDGSYEEWVYGCCALESYRDRAGSVTAYLYDDDDNLATQYLTTPASNQLNYISFTYDAAGRRVAQQDVYGNTATNTYYANGWLATVRDALGRTTSYEYDAAGRQTQITWPDATCTTNSYDSCGSLASVGGTHTPAMTYSNDCLGRRITETDALGFTTTSHYDLLGRATNLVYADSSYQVTEYDLRGNVVRQIGPVSSAAEEADATTVSVYDDHARITSQTNAAGQSTEWTYDSTHRNQIAWVQNDNGLVIEQRFYDSLGRMISNTLHGVTMQYAYDELDRAATNTWPDGSTEISAYDGTLLLTQTDRAGNTSSFGYDALGRQTSVTNARGKVTAYSYDSVGNLESVTDPLTNVTTYVYDQMNRRTQIVLPAQPGIEEPEARVTRFEYDGFGQLTVRKGDGAVPVFYAYDPAGRMTNMMDGMYNNTAFLFDSLGNLTNKIYADGSSYSYTYNARRWLTARTDAKGVTTSYAYNNIGQLTNVDYAADTDLAFSYDNLGRLTERTDTAGTWNWVYEDESSRELTNAGPYGAVAYTYSDPAKDLASVLVTGTTHQVDYAWHQGRLTNVYSAVVGDNFAYEYLTGSDLLETTRYLGQTATVYRTYDDADRLLTVAATNQAGTTLNSFTYTLDSTGRRTRRGDAGGGYIDYGYDDKDQLTNAVMTDAADPAYAAAYRYAYRYDRVGNRLNEHRGQSQTPSGVEGLDIDGTFNALNQLTNLAFSGRIDTYGTVTSTNSGLGVKVMGEDATMYDTTNFLGGALLGIGTNQGTYTLSVVTTNAPGYQSNIVFSVQLPPENPQPLLYDANGNLTNDGIWAYSWNDENRLSAIVPLSPAADKAKVELTYDGQGRRVKRVLYSGWNGSGYGTTNETRFVYDGWRVLAELSADNTVSNSYVWGLDLSQSLEGAGGIGALLALTGSSGDSYLYFFDGNGNVTHLYETDGSTEAAVYEYAPFGNITKSSGSMAETNTFRFSTKMFETDHGLYYYGYRFYSSNLGRWVNRDPVGEEPEVNLYAFGRNEPAGSFDLLGLRTCEEACGTIKGGKCCCTVGPDGKAKEIDPDDEDCCGCCVVRTKLKKMGKILACDEVGHVLWYVVQLRWVKHWQHENCQLTWTEKPSRPYDIEVQGQPKVVVEADQWNDLTQKAPNHPIFTKFNRAMEELETIFGVEDKPAVPRTMEGIRRLLFRIYLGDGKEVDCTPTATEGPRKPWAGRAVGTQIIEIRNARILQHKFSPTLAGAEW